MGAETEVIEHTVVVADASVTQDGFGTLGIAGYHTFWSELVKAFSDPDDMTLSPYNMPTTHAIYIAAQKAMSQEPHPSQFKVIKLLGPITHRVELVPGTPTAGEVFSLKVDGALVSVTADGAPTLAEVTLALTTAISALTDVTATDGSTKVTVAGDTAGVPHSYEDLSSNLKLTETTALPSPAPAVDLANAHAVDGDWYGLTLVNGGEASANNVAAWVETKKKIFIHTTPDAGVADAVVTTDIGSDLKGASYTRTGALFHERPVTEAAAAAWLGRMLPMLPGPTTFRNKALAGVTKSPLSDTQRNALKAKHVNYYVDVKGLGWTFDGWAASGRFFDITAILDWFDVGVESRILLMFHNNEVVPKTQKGVEMAVGQLRGQILEGIGLGLIDGASKFEATGPLIADISPADLADRLLPDLKYEYRLSGAFHKVKIKGTVKV